MFSESLEFINTSTTFLNRFMTREERGIAFIGLIFLIVIWICGGLYEKEHKEMKGEL